MENIMFRKFVASALFFTASIAGTPETSLPLWPGTAPGSENAPQAEVVTTDSEGHRAISHIARPALVPFYAEHPTGTAIIVSPGGGFRAEAFDSEGVEIARWLNTLGVDAYVLKYRLPAEGHAHSEDVILQDIQRAIRLVRAQKDHPAARVGTMGFSAGGNLTAISAVYHTAKVYTPIDAADTLSARPDFFAVIYGFIPRKDDTTLVRMPPENPTYRYLEKYLFEPAVTADIPPSFVIHGDADEHVAVKHGQRIMDAVTKAGGRCEFHIIKGANHGFGLRAIGGDRVWPALFAAWLKRLN
jgi:acetyl esterase/lipase